VCVCVVRTKEQKQTQQINMHSDLKKDTIPEEAPNATANNF
jgi:hypothetical protein